MVAGTIVSEYTHCKVVSYWLNRLFTVAIRSVDRPRPLIVVVEWVCLVKFSRLDLSWVVDRRCRRRQWSTLSFQLELVSSFDSIQWWWWSVLQLIVSWQRSGFSFPFLSFLSHVVGNNWKLVFHLFLIELSLFWIDWPLNSKDSKLSNVSGFAIEMRFRIDRVRGGMFKQLPSSSSKTTTIDLNCSLNCRQHIQMVLFVSAKRIDTAMTACHARISCRGKMIGDHFEMNYTGNWNVCALKSHSSYFL